MSERREGGIRFIDPSLEAGLLVTADSRDAVMTFPDHVWIHPDYGIASAYLAAGHRFQDETIVGSTSQLVHQRYRGIEIGGERSINNLVLPALKFCLKF